MKRLFFYLGRFVTHPAGKAITIAFGILLGIGFGVFLYYYTYYANMIEEKLAKGAYSNTSKLYGAPQVISLGDTVDVDEVIAALHRAGYSESRNNRMGWFQRRSDGLEIFPGPDSYFQQEAHVLRVEKNKVVQVISLKDNTDRTQLWLEPELITNLFDRNREKRRIVSYQDIPEVMRNAVLAAEDKRFFQHAGFDPFRIVKSAWVDLKSRSNTQGASTLSMQLARSVWLTNERNWRRKIPEILITMHLERKLTKEQIFEHYFNEIYLGRVGSFNIHGFGEGAQAYFGKDVRRLSLPEAAMLAGLVQSPAGYNPLRNPERAKKRRAVILSLMRDNGYITAEQAAAAAEAPLGVNPGGRPSEDAPYFVDLVLDQLQNQFQDHDFQANSYRIYTSLDVNVQREAAEAMKIGLAEVDKLMDRLGRTQAKGWPRVQAALVALDPENGEVKALIGGRDYGQSQLNRVLAKRQPGSIFKPFVYAAALATGLDGSQNAITPATMIVDEPTTFWYGGKAYEPNNFKSQFNGTVTLRQALSKSMNIPAVKVAEQVGYGQVAALARRAGLTGVSGTPSVALGSYDARPIDMAGAYTIFANRGVYAQPSLVRMIRNQDGTPIYTHKPVQKQALDPRVAYIVSNLMEGVIASGTAAGVRARGFAYPAAGKTGTSHDGWFAGYTTKLLAVVWVGYDDNRDIDLEGAKTALPIWTEFMKRVHRLRPYRRAGNFVAPDGVISVEIDAATGKLAGGCGGPSRTEVFLFGTQPLESCGGAGTHVASWDTPDSGQTPDVTDQPRRVASREVTSIPVHPRPARPEQQPAPNPEKPARRGLLDRIVGVFK